MMLPLRCACMARTSCFMLRTHAHHVGLERGRKLSAVWSVIGPTAPSVPALFTATSRRPNPRHGLVDHVADVILLADVGVDELGLRT